MKIEEELKKLEEITTHLEKDDLPLDEAISLFEEGGIAERGLLPRKERDRIAALQREVGIG
ncbi:exodeoxyribonuclease VII small subunit, partial [Candidatus Acetothermia bacterium]